MQPTIIGIILAAGASDRMGRPKALLEVGGETFMQRIAGMLHAAGCHRVLVVVNADADWASQAAASLDVEVVANPVAQSEQVDSLRLALLRAGDDVAAALVLPVDLPLMSPDTVRAVVDAYRARPAPLVLPFHNGVAGHPVLLDRALFAEILDGRLEEGIRSLIMDRAKDILEVKVYDPGILVDIDTPDDYWRYIQRK
jgi:molybdenum cofactor cytidylyltransferase